MFVDARFQGVNRLFVLSFEDVDGRESYKQCYFPTVEIKDYVMIDGRNLFDQPTKNHLKTYDNIRKIGHDYTFELVKVMITHLDVY